MTLFKRYLLIDPLFFLSVTIILYILRMVGPYINYVFIPFLFIYFIYSTIHYFYGYKSHNNLCLIIFQFPFLIISLFFLIGIIASSSFIFFAFKELLNVFIFIFLSFSFFLFVNNKEDLNKFTWIFCKQFILFSVIVSLLGLTKFGLQLLGIEATILNFSGQIVGTSLTSDYNFFSLFSLIGILALVLNTVKFKKISFTLIFILLNINILFSSSRRGILVLLMIWFILFLFGFNFKFNLKKIVKKILIFCIILSAFTVSFPGIRNHIFIKQKNQSIDFNTKFQDQIQFITTQLIFRYLTVINSDKPFSELYKELWGNDNFFNSKINYDKYNNPKGGKNLLYNGNFNYGLLFWEPEANATKHELVKTPYGNGVRVSRFAGDNENWPLLYKGREIIFYKNHTYAFEFKYRVVKGIDRPFNIGFWADDSYLGYGESYSLGINIKDLENGWKEGIGRYTFLKSHFNIPLFMNSQSDSTIIEFAEIKLIDTDTDSILPKYADEISSEVSEIEKYLKHYDDSIVDSTLNLQNRNKNLFSNGDFKLGTHFWIPNADSTKHEIIETPFGKGIRVSRTNGDGGYWSLWYDGRPIIYYAGHRYRLRFNFKVEKGNALPFNIGWWVNDANQGFSAHVLPLAIRNINDGWKETTCTYKFKETHYNLPTFLNSLQDYSVVDIANVELIDLNRNDSLPTFVDQIKKAKQTPKPGITDIIDFRDYKNSFYSPRLNRWFYSWVVFQDSLSTPQKIFGGGFDYLEMFGKKFGETKIDDPHNPFLSAFLYSGILGGIAYIWFMFLVFYYYIRYFKYHIYFFVCFLMVFFFSFVSANTHFSIPIYSILCIIPFLTRRIVELEKLE